MASSDGDPSTQSDARSGPAMSSGDGSNQRDISSQAPDDYKMNNKERGYAIIINNKTFDSLNEREGTDKDKDTMMNLLMKLGFKRRCIVVKDSISADDMIKVMEEAAEKDHSNCDCFVAVVLSHGKDNGRICGKDKEVTVANLTAPFKRNKCRTLNGKPKIFFIQACRGEAEDEEVTEHDAEEDEDDEDTDHIQIPSEADYLLAYSVVPGFKAWRHESKGSWFIQSIGKVFNENWQKDDLVTMLTKVNKMVAYDYDEQGVKQMPCINSMLTKKVFFS